MNKTEQRKNNILDLISCLFRDETESEEDQVQALEEIADLATQNAETLQMQIDARE